MVLAAGQSVALVLLQIAAILVLSRVMGVLFARLRQPQVVGEMLAGIMLGPSLLGWLATPNPLFPQESLDRLHILSQLGVVLFLFLVGLEFDPALVRGRGKEAAAISLGGIALPFALGFALTYLIRDAFDPLQQASLFPSALFVGAAISVTAFPVLARILSERDLTKTRVGLLSITAAAVNDVLAWTMLALVVAFAPGDGSGDPLLPLWKLLNSVAYLALMVLLVRPMLRRVDAVYERQGRLSQDVIAVIFLLLLASAAATELIGVHALFGAFVAGAVMPKRSRFVRHLSEKLEDVTVVFLLPVFFAYVGLQTDVRTIVSAEYIGTALLMLAVACAGKVIGAAVPAWLLGSRPREALAVGVLMNTRGLMELIILTIGLGLGVINNAVYGMMVVMAIVTTSMTTPLIHAILPRRLIEGITVARPGKRFTVLVPVARPDSGGGLVRMAALIAGKSEQTARILALHLRRPVDRESFRLDLDRGDDDDGLRPLLAQAQADGVSVDLLRFASRDIPSDIARVARSQHADLILMGFHKPVFSRTILGGTVHRVLAAADCDVAVLVDRGFSTVRRILVPYHGSRHDRLALDLAGRCARSSDAEIVVLHVVAGGEQRPRVADVVERTYRDPALRTRVTLKVVPTDSSVDAVIEEASRGYDLVVVGVEDAWGLESHLFGFRPERIADECAATLLLARESEPDPAPGGLTSPT